MRRVAFKPLRRIQWSSSSSPSDKNEDAAKQEEIDLALLDAHGIEKYGAPTDELCATMPRKFRHASNEVLSILSAQQNHGARKERLLREIMRVDKVSYLEARKTLVEINKSNDMWKKMVTLPYKIGIFGGFFAGTISIPLVCHKPSAVWFNDQFVHCPAPDDGLESLENCWLVGEWTWGWMEPCLGTISFLLLAFQFSRAQMGNMQWQPYTERVLGMRANRLADIYPDYERQIIRDYSKTDPWDK